MTDTKLLQEPAPPPAMSPSSAAKPARGLRQKVFDELKSVRRKSDKSTPASTPLVEPAGSGAAVVLPPLVLNPLATTADDAADGDARLSAGQLSPAEPVPGKLRGCAICERSFTVFRAKHTCKVCGSRICDDCSKSRVKLHRRLERKKGSRICDPCARKYASSASTPLLSPSASPLLVPQNSGDNSRLRRHSVPSQVFAHPLAKPTEADDASGSALPAAAAASDETTSGGSGNTSKLARGPVRGSPWPMLHNSHLRLRHWLSLALVSALVLARLLLGGSMTSSTGEALARTVDRLLSLKILGCYVLGLAVFDEVQRSTNPQRVTPAAAAGGTRRRRRTHNRAVLGRQPSSGVTATGRHIEPDDDVLEVDTGDKVEDTSSFSLERLIAVLEETGVRTRAAGDELQLASFLACCESICVFVLVFGRATSFAGSTVGGYITTITANVAAWPAPETADASTSSSWLDQSVRTLIEREVELKVAAVGGKKKPSCSRCVQRLLWFLEFVEACLRHTMIESMDESCSAGASRAYEETIGSRHPWIIRKGVNSALGSIPTRSAIMSALCLGALSPEDAVARLQVAQHHLRAIIGEIAQTFKKHDLLDIK